MRASARGLRPECSLSGAKGDAIRAKKKRKLHNSSSAAGAGLSVVDTEGGWDSIRHGRDEDEEGVMVVESRDKASFRPINAAARLPTPEPEPDDEEPTVVETAFKGGLQSAAQLAEANARKKRQEEKLRKKQLKEANGKEQKTVHRDATGKARDTKKERIEARREEREKLEKDMARMEWGKGLVQREDKERKRREEEAMAAKPVARYADDDDLNADQRAEMRWNDPAAQFLTVCVRAIACSRSSRPQKPSGSASKKSTRPAYRGPPPPPNRFGIQPGSRWDGAYRPSKLWRRAQSLVPGVDRSTGFERKLLNQANVQKIQRDQAYKWSAGDM
jgi:pre-mRNA-splicing factor CWC26